jgi:hypothetical protein
LTEFDELRFQDPEPSLQRRRRERQERGQLLPTAPGTEVGQDRDDLAHCRPAPRTTASRTISAICCRNAAVVGEQHGLAFIRQLRHANM